LRAPRRDAGLVIVLVLALLGTSTVGLLHNECDLCPPGCPMHQHDGQQPGSRLGCHGGGGALAARFNQHSAPHHGPSVRCATCGNHGIVSAITLPPMLLPSVQPLSTLAAVRAARFAVAAPYSRVIDPPDTPPPIGTA